MGMTEQQDIPALEREEIASRVATFKATQEKFAREREEYFVTTLENANAPTHSSDRRSGPERGKQKPGDDAPGFSIIGYQ
jgi:hypothetical protein